MIAWGHELCKLRLELKIRSLLAGDDLSLLSCHQLEKSGKGEANRESGTEHLNGSVLRKSGRLECMLMLRNPHPKIIKNESRYVPR